jgi:hypothetical protein
MGDFELDLDYRGSRDFWLCDHGAPRSLAAVPDNTNDAKAVD